MIVNSNSWHYRFWRWTWIDDGLCPPSSTDLCSYVNRIVWFVFLVGLMVVVLGIPALIFGFVLSFKPPYNRVFNRYNGLKLFGRELYPWHVLLPVGIVWLEYLGFRSCSVATTVGMNLAIVGPFAVFAWIVWGTPLSKNETVALVLAWFSAKKRAVCPLIEFKDEPTSMDDDATL